MQKLEDHIALFVRVPHALFDAVHAEAKARQVVLRVVITDALKARFAAPHEPVRPAYTSPGPEVVFRSPVLAPETRQAITDTLSRSPPNRALDGSRATPAGKPMSKADQVRALREDKAR